MVRQYQTMFYKKHYSATDIDRKTDFIALAKAFGADGVRVETAAQFEKALNDRQKVLNDRKQSKLPFVIECLIDKDEPVLPMLKPNGSTEDIILGMKELTK